MLVALGSACEMEDPDAELSDQELRSATIQTFANPVQIGTGKQKMAMAGDFDNDGRVDVGQVLNNRPTLAFGASFSHHEIHGTDLDWSGAGVVADFDGDGLLDVGYGDDGYDKNTPGAWRIYRNPGANSADSSTWSRHTVFNLDPANHLNDAVTGDLDLDGKMDLVVRSRAHDNRFIVSMNNNINSWDTVTFSPSQYNTKYPEGVAVGDVTGDGRPDVIADGYFLHSNNWRSGNASEVTFSEDWVREEAKMWVEDINADGRNDILITAAERGSKRLSWFEAPNDPINGTWIEHVIHDNNGEMHFLQTADMDGDGDPDVVTGGFKGFSNGGDGIKIYYNNNNGSSWTRDDMSTYGIYHGAILDFDGDGDLDILGVDGYNRKLYYHKNTTGGGGGSPPPPASYPRLEGEDYDAASAGVGVYDGGTGQKIGSAQNGDWARYDDVNLANVASLTARVSSKSSSGTIEVRLNGQAGTKIADIPVPVTGGWNSFQTIEAPVSGSNGVHDLYLKWTNGSSGWGDVDYIEFEDN